VFRCNLDFTRTAPCVRIFGSVVWYPVFLRHEIHRYLACQVGGCGVFLRNPSTFGVPARRLQGPLPRSSSDPCNPGGYGAGWSACGWSQLLCGLQSAFRAPEACGLAATLPSNHSCPLQWVVRSRRVPAVVRRRLMQLEVMGASWRTSSRWLQRTSPGDGSWASRQDPSRPGGISVSASSTSMLPRGRSQRARRRTLPSSQGARRQG
jgi:hypothetical protein